MAHKTVVRNKAYQPVSFNTVERHNERKNDEYYNGDVELDRAHLNVHYRRCLREDGAPETYILGDYARTIQPQTLSRRSSDGSAASPDIARLKGARLVNMPEPEKGLELNTALVVKHRASAAHEANQPGK